MVGRTVFFAERRCEHVMATATHRRSGTKQWHYVLLLLPAAAFLFQSFYAAYVVRFYKHPEKISRPPLQFNLTKTVTTVLPEAADAGIRPGDVVTSVDGHSLNGEKDFQGALRRAPGTLLPITVVRRDGGAFATTIRRTAFGSGAYSFDVWLFVVVALLLIPAVSLSLGLSIVLRRIWDFRAWLILAMMMSFSQLYYLSGWIGPCRTLALTYRDLAATSFGIWLILFSACFPARAQWDRDRPWIKWILILPISALALTLTAEDTLAQNHLNWIAPWSKDVEVL